MIGKRQKKPLISTPQTNKQTREESSPTKATVLLQAQTSQYLKSIRNKKQNYATALDLYQACYENQLPQKCLKHLNFITLYCESQNKLLCVNCLYGSTFHKNHKVIPSNSASELIAADNEENIKSLEEEYESIREAQSKIKENRRSLQQEKQIVLKQIDNEFAQIYKMIEFKHKQLKQRAIQNFSKASEENEDVQREIGWWKEQVHYTKSRFPREGKSEEAQLYKHLVLELMLNERLQTQKLTYQASEEEMEHEFLSEARQLKAEVSRRVQSKQVENRDSRRIRLF